MEDFRLVEYTPAHFQAIEQWQEHDPEGIEAIIGGRVEGPTALALGMAYLLQAVEHGQAAVRMVERAGQPVGMVMLTLPTQASAYVHIYVDPNERRHSLSIGRIALDTARDLGVETAVALIRVTNQRAVMFAKMLGFEEEAVTLVKSLKEPPDGRSRTSVHPSSRRRRSHRGGRRARQS